MVKKILFLLLFTLMLYSLSKAQNYSENTRTKLVNQSVNELPNMFLSDVDTVEKLSAFYTHSQIDKSLDSIVSPIRPSYSLYSSLCDAPLERLHNYSWDLYKGLNVILDFSVFAHWGKGVSTSTGLSQQLSALYVHPWGERTTLIVGGYLNNVYYLRDNYHIGGIMALLSYRFNDKAQMNIYIQKNLISHNNIPYLLYERHRLEDKIGASLQYKVNRNIWLEVSLEKTWLPMSIGVPYFDMYNYPVPKP